MTEAGLKSWLNDVKVTRASLRHILNLQHLFKTYLSRSKLSIIHPKNMFARSETDANHPPEEYEPLPSSVWSLGVHDAHCHPTDTMSTAPTIPSMKSSGLTIMSTRFQDQSLVAKIAEEYGVYDPKAPSESRGRVIPSFGYHPWFSYLIWDDEVDDLKKLSAEELKVVHYKRVLTSNPTDELIVALPEPKRLSEVLKEMREHLERFPVALVGEIGLDRGFRIPFPSELPFTQEHSEISDKEAGRIPEQEDEGRRLSPHRVSMTHQKRIFVAQLKLAGDLKRAASVHGVQCHGAMFDTLRELWKGHEVVVESKKELKRRRRKGEDGHEYLPDYASMGDESSEEDEEDYSWLMTKKSSAPPPVAVSKPFPPRVCLHSFSAPLQTLQQYLTKPSPKHQYPSQVYFSFSTTVNARSDRGHMSKIMDTIKEVPNDRVLIESDLHTAGEDMDKALEGALRLIADVKGLEISDCASKLGTNWREFVFGSDDS